MDRGGRETESSLMNIIITDLLISPDFFSREVNNCGDEVLPHDDRTDLLPVGCALAQEQANGLQSQFDGCRWISHGTDLHQVLLLNRLNSYRHRVNNDEDYDEEKGQ